MEYTTRNKIKVLKAIRKYRLANPISFENTAQKWFGVSNLGKLSNKYSRKELSHFCILLYNDDLINGVLLGNKNRPTAIQIYDISGAGLSFIKTNSAIEKIRLFVEKVLSLSFK